MKSSIVTSLDRLSAWRAALDREVTAFAQFTAEHELADDADAAVVSALRERLASDKLVLAFVAEFSRGKSELINAIFFADAGRRVLPATPGRTTMCPVELHHQAGQAPRLSLLPIETRLQGLAMAELRGRDDAWQHLPLDPADADAMANALTAVTRTQRVSVETAITLGFWNEAEPDDNPPLEADGNVEVPAWRHALINYPHPLLKQGLVVLDTPGLNAIGAEPELTLGLLPSAHATVFILGADTGVTRSDLTIWRDHLGANAPTRFVVLNKIDALVDPLATPEQVDEQIDQQKRDTARTLSVAPARVFPLSARQALAGRVAGDAALLERSRLPALEAALAAELLPQRRRVMAQVVIDATHHIEAHVARRMSDNRRQLAEQMLELRGLRGKSGSKLRMMLKRVDAETAEFEQCTTKLQAMRVVHSRMLKDALVGISSDRLREEIEQLQTVLSASLLKLGAKKAFGAMCGRLRALLDAADRRSHEIHDMLKASFAKLNAEFGFSLALDDPPELKRYAADLAQIESSYVQYLGLTQALRLSQPKFMEQFRRMLTSKLRVVFENASAELELWNKGASGQVDAQLRDRRKGFRRRHEALERIQTASSELEMRITELEAQDHRLQHNLGRVAELADALREQARQPGPGEEELISIDLPPTDEPVPLMLRHAGG